VNMLASLMLAGGEREREGKGETTLEEREMF
jgi:hypothetical protein